MFVIGETELKDDVKVKPMHVCRPRKKMYLRSLGVGSIDPDGLREIGQGSKQTQMSICSRWLHKTINNANEDEG